jgi:hypothetical protein
MVAVVPVWTRLNFLSSFPEDITYVKVPFDPLSTSSQINVKITLSTPVSSGIVIV